MNANAFPYRLNWTHEQIADAVPLRLFELVDGVFETDAPHAGNDLRPVRPRAWRGAYSPKPSLPALVHVRH